MNKTRHPEGVITLLIVNTLERFGFWGLRSLLTLYLIEPFITGGLGWNAHDAIAFEGLFGGIVYFIPIIGGRIADKLLGYRRAMFFGNLFIAFGIISLAIHRESMVYLALIAVSIGNGLFKPCITSMLGKLYAGNDELREQGYRYLYQTVLIGVMGSALICGWVLPHYGFIPAFIIAAFAPALGSLIFFVRFYKPLDESSHTTLVEKAPLALQEKKNMLVIGIFALFAIVFFAAQAQGSGLLAVYIHRYTDHDLLGWYVPTIWLMSIGTIFGIAFVPLYNMIWTLMRTRGSEPTLITKFIIGIGSTSVAFFIMMGAALQASSAETHRSSMWWLLAFHIAFVSGKTLVIPLLWGTVEKLAPERYRFLMMGAILGCISIGNIIGGQLGALMGQFGMAPVFVMLSVMCLATVFVLVLANRKIMNISSDVA